ncbi:MAG: peptidoglycan synthetase, partial [Lutibacter sp.]
RDAFEREDLIVYTDPTAFREFLFHQNFENTVVLLMSSGNYGGLDFDKFKALI